MIKRPVGLVAIALLCSIGVAAAQETEPRMTVSPEALNDFLSKVKGMSHGQKTTVNGSVAFETAGGVRLGSVEQVPLGWNFFVAEEFRRRIDGLLQAAHENGSTGALSAVGESGF